MSVCRSALPFASAALAFAACTTGFAQTHTQQREEVHLSEAARAKLHTLETLTTLPAEEWRMHVGDLPHGEATTLDDKSWESVKAPYTGSTEATWFRHTVIIPRTLNGYDISGSRLYFQFRADANGPMPQIIYFNGRRVALGDDLEPIILDEPVKPGDTIQVAVKLLHTVDVKNFRGATLRIEAVAPAVATHAAPRPSPEDLRIECLAAANILPSLTPSRADLLPKVEQAIAAIDTRALASANQAAFDASLRKAQSILDAVRPTVEEAKITLTGNSHIDAAWLWPASETVDVVKRTFTTALQLMNEYPNYTFTQSAAQYSEWMADKYPKLNDQISERIKEGRWEIVGGMWVEPDLNMPDGESLVRQLLVGQRYFQKEYGVTTRIGWNPDSFGYNWQLPQIYKRSGVDYFVTQKMHWNDTNQLPFRLFWWQSPDGSKVLTYFPTDYTHGNVSPARISADFAESSERNPGTSQMMDLYGVGDHGGGPTRSMLDEAEHYLAASTPGSPGTEQLTVPTMRYGTAQHFLSSVEAQVAPESPVWNYDRIGQGWQAPPTPPAGQMSVPTWNDELYLEFHRGVFTTQANHKHNMRSSEVATLDAEKLASLAWLGGAAYPNDTLTDNWRKITFNQFHDLAAGSGIGVIYRDAQKDYDKVFSTDKIISDDALSGLAARIDTRVKGGTPILLFNPLAWQRSETVKLTVQLPERADGIRILDDKDKPVVSQMLSHDAATGSFTVLARVENLPSLGYKLIHAQATSDAQADAKKLVHVDDQPGAFALENSALRVTVDRKTGCITSLVDTKTRAESIAANACGNQLQTFVDTPKEYDAWNVDPGTFDHNTPIDDAESVNVISQGPLRATVEVKRHWGKSSFTQRISLDAGADTVEVSNDVEWHETHVLLKAAFPVAAKSDKATYEIPYGSIERPTTRNNSYEKARFEVPAMRWADLGDAHGGLSILNDSKYGYDAVDGLLRLTLLRSPTSPDPDADRGHQSFRYALYPHAGTWKQAETMHRGYEFNYPVSAVQLSVHEGSLPKERSFFGVDNPNVVVTAVKKAEDSNALVIRMVEWAGQGTEVKLHIPAGATTASETNLMEKAEGAAISVSGDIVSAPIKPYEILTLQVGYNPPANTASTQER